MGFLDKLGFGNRAVPDDDYYRDDEFDESYHERRRSRRDLSGKVVNIHTTAQLPVVIFKPAGSDDCVQIADNLLEKRYVVVNFEDTSKEKIREMFNFISGVSYALECNIKQIANKIYIITPFNVGIEGSEVLDELENNGFFF